MADIVDLATRIGQEVKTLREEAVKGIPGDPGPKGEPGGSDAATAEWISSGPLTQEAGDLRWASAATVEVRAGNSSFTNGSIVRIGEHSYITRSDVNMAVVLGGGTTGNENVIGGNFDNVNTSTSNLLNPPTLTGTDGQWNFIMNGYDNVANGWAIILNGFHNRVKAGGNHATISGGSIHTIGNNNYSTIGGGTGHNINDGASGGTIGGGVGNTIGMNATSTTIAGGNANTVSQLRATVGGGNGNTASANAATVAGGDSNTASGSSSAIPGGTGNVASGAFSVATGAGAVAASNGMRSHGAQFASPGDAQDSTVIMKVETSAGTETGLSLHGYGGLILPENTTWAVDALVVARRTDVDGENAAWRITALVKRDAGSTTALIGTPTITPLGANDGNTWAVAVTTFTAGNLNIRVTGEANKTIRWLATLRIAHVSG